MTDGRISYVSAGGEGSGEVKSFHVRDGSALKRWHAAGKSSAVITGRSSPVVARRAAELGVAVVVQGAVDKAVSLETILRERGLSPAALCCVGDDAPDVALLRQAGLAVAPADAGPAVRSEAHYITRAGGGGGVIAEVVALVLGCQGLSDS